MKIESHHPAEDKRQWKIVRLDDYTDVEGEIVAADDETGDCCMQRPDGNGGSKTETLPFGPGGIKIVGRGR